MTDGTRAFRTLLLTAALAWHVLCVLAPAWVQTFEQSQARDFASYYYAVKVASKGGDPYDAAKLSEFAQDDGTRKSVHPFLYAPPFVLGMTWATGLELPRAYHLWFWLDEACAIATAVVLWRWWRHLSPDVGLIVVVLFAVMTALPNNHTMGQANFPGLLLTIAGLWAAERGRLVLGGVLMGLACMLKMSPALFLLLWAIRGQWRAIGAAVAAAVGVSLLTVPLVGLGVQWRFYTEILPSFSSGYYNGLAVPIGLFGNHSLPNVLDALWPGGEHRLSTLVRFLLMLTVGALVVGSTWAFGSQDGRRSAPFQVAAQSAFFGVALLLLPVFTYEHHLVFALPAAVLTTLAVREGRLPAWAIAPAGLAVAILVVDLQLVKGLVESMPRGVYGFQVALRELKFLSLLGLLATTGALGRAALPTPSPAPVAA